MDFDFQTLFIVYVIVLNSFALSISDIFKQDDEDKSGPAVLIFYINLILVVIPIIIIYFFF